MEVRARKRIVTAAFEDWVSLAEAVGHVRDEHPNAPLGTVRARTIDLISEMVHEGIVEIGDLRPRFVRWELAPGQAIEALTRAWDASADLSPGDVCWLALTREGVPIGRELYDALPDPRV